LPAQALFFDVCLFSDDAALLLLLLLLIFGLLLPFAAAAFGV